MRTPPPPTPRKEQAGTAPSRPRFFSRGARWASAGAACLLAGSGVLLGDSVVVFNEVHYNPGTGNGTEWVELYNQMSSDVDLSGWRLDDAVRFTFPEGTVIAAGGTLVVAADPAGPGLPAEGVIGPFEGRLADGGERLELINNAGRRMDALEYNDAEPWPLLPDGSGATLAKLDPGSGTAPAAHWAASATVGGTPGAPNFPGGPPAPGLDLNEVAAAGPAGSFWVELVNRGAATAEFGGWILTVGGAGDPAVELPAGTLAPGELTVLEIGGPAAAGAKVFLYGPGREEAGGAAVVEDRPIGRSPGHGARWLAVAEPTPGAPNRFDLEDAIVINEILYRGYPLPARPPSPAVVETVEQVGFSATWRYDQTGAVSGTAWREADFDDAAWAGGPAGFAASAISLPVTRRTTLQPGPVTYYFRTTFELAAPPAAGADLQLRAVVDDGAVFYLNGQEVARFNLPPGPVDGFTLASSAVDQPSVAPPVNLPVEAFRAGRNVLAAEVHQSSFIDGDMAFATELVTAVEIEPAVEGAPFRDPDGEWIELYNRGAEAVDLSGWELDDAVRFTFPDGTVLGPGDYLVVSNDAAALDASRPGIENLLGDFRGGLDNSGERVLLLDANGNPADVVAYRDGGRWPWRADGGGSSLELRDPRADNALPGSWAASDEAPKAAWQEVRYRMPSGQAYGLSTWNEFRLGLLTAGEVLVDDVSVVEDPDGARRELIQNRTFGGSILNPEGSTDRWRFIGNHRHTRLAGDPDDVFDPVLLIDASGATDTKHNHLETTFDDNRRLVDGRGYEVSFRARWVSGSNRLRSSAYYARLARTTELEVPRTPGTPGGRNSRFEENIGPGLDGLRHAPALPQSTEAVTVSVQAADPDGVGELTLLYAVDGGVFREVAMAEGPAAPGLFTAAVPPQARGAVVQFYVTAVDLVGAESFLPAAGAGSRALYVVDDGAGTALPLHELRLVMTRADRDFLLAPLNLMSNERIGGTVISNRRTVTYDVGVRMKGSGAGRARDGSLYQGYQIAFPAGELFRGVHGSVSVDRSGRAPAAGRQDEIYIKHVFNRAGLPAMYDDLIYFVAPQPAHTSTALLSMARYGGLFTRTQFGDGGDGAVFNLEITYDPVSTTDGDPESPKPPVPFQHIGTDFTDLGDDKEQYRGPMEIRTGRRHDDFSGLIRFCQTMALPSAELAAGIDEVMDVDQWMRCAALVNLCGIADTWFHGGLQHNLRVYVPPAGAETGGARRAVVLPWDMDFVFQSGATAGVRSAGNLRRVMEIPAHRRLYHGHLHDLVNTVFTERYLGPWMEHYGSRVGQGFSGQIGQVRSRADDVRAGLPPKIPFAITTNGGRDFAVNESSATLRGRGWINVREIRQEESGEELEVAWTGDDTWEVTVPLRPGENAITLEALDFQGTTGSVLDPVGSASVVVTSTGTAPTPVEFLRVSELNYHPAPPTEAEMAAGFSDDDDFEFIELTNTGEETLSIGGVRFTDGVAYTVPEDTVIPPGGFAVVARNPPAFTARYGEIAAPLLGPYEPDNFSNRGEAVELRDRPGNRILSFRYRDGWLPSTDGAGHSLEVADPRGPTGALDAAAGWRVSGERHGSPGRAAAAFGQEFAGWRYGFFSAEEVEDDDLAGEDADPDGDGRSNFFEYALGGDPRRAEAGGAAPAVSPARVAGRLHISYRRPARAVDLTFAAEVSGDLLEWSPAGAPLRTEDLGDGREEVEFEDPGANPAAAARFFRLRVSGTR